ncbi:MAG TPA: MOSC domain-containing protein [Euzebyales bacterium]|nr:MOSC domain-containing protein [Euzebyales bacterium]
MGQGVHGDRAGGTDPVRADPHVTHVNVATPRPKMVGNRVVGTAIDKHPVDGRVEVGMEGLVTDQVGDARHHGGNEQALYAFAGEDYDHWEHELGRELRPGLFGENLTTRGIDVNAVLIGERGRIGTVRVEVSGPRIPCATFAVSGGGEGLAPEVRRPRSHRRLPARAGGRRDRSRRPDRGRRPSGPRRHRV